MIYDQQGRPASPTRDKRTWVAAFRNCPEAAMEDPAAVADDQAAPPPAKAKVSHNFAVLRLKLETAPRRGCPCPRGFSEDEIFGVPP